MKLVLYLLFFVYEQIYAIEKKIDMSLKMNDIRKEHARRFPLSRKKVKQAFKAWWTDEQIESLLDSHAEGTGPFYLMSDLSALTETRLQEAASDYEGLT